MSHQVDAAVPQRITAIDTLRGFALLGILLMNIMLYAMPQIAYFNPTAYFGTAWYDRLAYALVHVVAENKFMAIFSMLFGAGVVVITNRAESRGLNPVRYHSSQFLASGDGPDPHGSDLVRRCFDALCDIGVCALSAPQAGDVPAIYFGPGDLPIARADLCGSRRGDSAVG